MVAVHETFKGTGQIVVEYSVLRISVFAVHEAVGFGRCNVSYEVLEFFPVNLAGVDLVTAETVESEGDVGSRALFEVAKRPEDLAKGDF